MASSQMRAKDIVTVSDKECINKILMETNSDPFSYDDTPETLVNCINQGISCLTWRIRDLNVFKDKILKRLEKGGID